MQWHLHFSAFFSDVIWHMLMHVTHTTLHCKKIRALSATGDLKALEKVNGFDSGVSVQSNHLDYSKTI